MLRQIGQRRHLRLNAAPHAGFGEILRIHAGEHGHADKQRLVGATGHGFDGGFHHAPAARGVHIDHPHAHIGGHFASLRHGVGNIVVFQIEKKLEALVNQAFGQVAAAGGEKLFADFELASVGLEPAHKGERAFFIGKIQRHNHGRARGGGGEIGD